MPPLTTHWSRRQQPPLVPRCGCWRGSPRAFGACGGRRSARGHQGERRGCPPGAQTDGGCPLGFSPIRVAVGAAGGGVRRQPARRGRSPRDRPTRPYVPAPLAGRWMQADPWWGPAPVPVACVRGVTRRRSTRTGCRGHALVAGARRPSLRGVSWGRTSASRHARPRSGVPAVPQRRWSPPGVAPAAAAPVWPRRRWPRPAGSQARGVGGGTTRRSATHRQRAASGGQTRA